MRVTENMNYDVLRTNIGRSRERMEKLQTEEATMKKLNTPSDNPVGASKVLEVRTDKMNNDQFIANAKNAESFLTNTEQALQEMTDLVVRAKEIAINQSSDASSSPESRLGVARKSRSSIARPSRTPTAASGIVIFSVAIKRTSLRSIRMADTAV